MRHLVHSALLLSLCSTQVLASETQLVELIVFRQSSESLTASRVAPDSWANGAIPITAKMQRSTHLGHLTEKLTPNNGYQVLLHRAWLQDSTNNSAQMAISEGEQHFDHYPIEGTLDFALDRTSAVQLDLWINQFNANQTLRSSERFKQKALVPNGKVTFVDNGTLGALIRIQPQNSPAQNQPENISPEHAADFE